MPTPEFINDPLIKAAPVRAHLGGISNMTLHRHVKAKKIPKPKYINGIRYWRQSEIERAVIDMLAPGLKDPQSLFHNK